MNEEVVVDLYSLVSIATSSAPSVAQSPNASSFETAKASLSSSSEVEYLHPLLEVEASEGSESRHIVRSYETEE